MGQTSSVEPATPRTREQWVHEIARKLAGKCFTPLEIYSLRDVFRQLADQEGGVRYLREDTIARFLELPDVLCASPVVFRLVSYLGAFPFLRDAPAVLGLEQLVVAIALLTPRYKGILAGGAGDRTKLIFGGLAVHDRRMSEAEMLAERADAETRKGGARDARGARGARGARDVGGAEAATATASAVPGFVVDVAADDVEDADDDDDLMLEALEELHVDEAFRHGDAPSTAGAMIPGDNFRKLVMLLLVIAPLDAQESLSQHSSRFVGNELEALQSAADSILATFLNVEKSPGIKYRDFRRIVPASFPYMLDGFGPLFEHFLFSNNLDFTKHKEGPGPASPSTAAAAARPSAPPKLPEPAPVLITRGEIMNYSVLSQLSFFIPGTSLFRRLRPLYSGNEDGFSVGSFESKVFHWRAPTILLVRGTRIDDVPEAGPETAFVASVPVRKFPHGSRGDALTFGLYLNHPWRHTHKECFGDSETVLFQLEPVHDVFRASSTINTDYVAFAKPPSHQPYLSVGSPHALPTQAHRRGPPPHLPLGPVSLVLDASFEFGVFNHDYASHGGAFAGSGVRRFNFQDRFAVESLEVWGCGGDEEAKVQADRWLFERREAEARRRINIGTGDIEADRALLEMAGLIGGNRSGGSMA